MTNRLVCKHPQHNFKWFVSLQSGWKLCKLLVCVSPVSYIQNVTAAFSIHRGIPRLPLPYKSQWASSTLTHSDNCLLLPLCCLAVDTMLGGKSLFPNLTRRIAGAFSTVKRLRSRTAAVFPDWQRLCWGTMPESLIDTSLPSAKTARFAKQGCTLIKLVVENNNRMKSSH